MPRYQQSNCPGCGRPVVVKVGHPSPNCPDCATAHEAGDTVTRMLCLRIDELQAEKDALAAHLNAPVIDDAIEALGHAQYWQEQEEVESWKAGAPTTSLARLKAEWQAEVLEEAGRYIRCEEDAALLRINAQELRRQAEGGE